MIRRYAHEAKPGQVIGAARAPQFILADRRAELPFRDVGEGDFAYARDTEGFYKRTRAGWVEVVAAGEQVGPPGIAGSRAVGITIDGGGSPISAGFKGVVRVPFGGLLTRWTLLADQVGGVVVDVWKGPFASSPPTVAKTITGQDKPSLISEQQAEHAVPATWTATVAAGDVIAFNVDSADTITRVSLVLDVQI